MAGGLSQDEPELAAMSTVLAALKPLGEDERSRVVEWVVGKLDIATLSRKRAGPRDLEDDNHDDGDDELGEGVKEFSDFAELCSAASPSTDAQKALVAGFWFQVCQGQDTFGSAKCNSQLKHFGTPIGNITRAFDTLKNSTPRLAMQVQKGGKTKQARKKYKLTHQGIEEVKRMING